MIARNSSFTYKGKAVDIPAGGARTRRALRAGRQRAQGRQPRAHHRAADRRERRGAHLWAERYDRDLNDIFAVQDDVTQQIVAALKVTLSEAEKSLIADSGTTNVDAHDFFLRGRELIWGGKRDREMFDQSTVCFRRAIELDPNYAAPYAGLGMAYILDYQHHWSDTPEKSFDQAEHMVSQSIAKDDKDPFAHYVAAVVYMWKRNYERWAHEADRALSRAAFMP